MDTITLEVTPAPPVCTPPQELFCTSDGCSCVLLNEPPRACKVTVSYPEGAPAADMTITVTPPGCASASVELALAIAVTKCLQALCGAP